MTVAVVILVSWISLQHRWLGVYPFWIQKLAKDKERKFSYLFVLRNGELVHMRSTNQSFFERFHMQYALFVDLNESFCWMLLNLVFWRTGRKSGKRTSWYWWICSPLPCLYGGYLLNPDVSDSDISRKIKTRQDSGWQLLMIPAWIVIQSLLWYSHTPCDFMWSSKDSSFAALIKADECIILKIASYSVLP